MSVHKTDQPQSSDEDYKVGYCHPPKETQFKKGQSGNPKGRKRKPESVRDQTESALSRKVTVTEGGRTKKLSVQEVIIRGQISKAIKGDLKSAAFLFHLLNAPEYADTDLIDQADLLAEDQAMLDEMIRKIAGAEGTDPQDRPAASDGAQPDEAPPEADDTGPSQPPDTSSEEGAYGDDSDG